jgi:hypothetical protein
MELDEAQEAWERDAEKLALVGRALFPQRTRIQVRLPASLANEAVAAWQRDGYSDDLPDHETAEQRRARSRAATLSLFGLSVEERGVVEGDEVVVELDAWFIGHALAAADDDGLLRDISPTGEDT